MGAIEAMTVLLIILILSIVSKDNSIKSNKEAIGTAFLVLNYMTLMAATLANVFIVIKS